MDKSLAKLKNALDQQLHYVSTGAGNAEVLCIVKRLFPCSLSLSLVPAKLVLSFQSDEIVRCNVSMQPSCQPVCWCKHTRWCRPERSSMTSTTAHTVPTTTTFTRWQSTRPRASQRHSRCTTSRTRQVPLGLMPSSTASPTASRETKNRTSTR